MTCHPKLTNSCHLWRNSFTGQGGAPHRSRCRERLRRSPSPRPLALHLAASRSRSPSLPAAESPACTLRSSPTPSQHRARPCTPPNPRKPLAASLRTPQPRRLPTASAITAARPRLKDLPALPHRFENRSAANARMASSANRQGVGGPTIKAQPPRTRLPPGRLTGSMPSRIVPALTGVHRGANPGSFPPPSCGDAVRSGHRNQHSET